MGEYYYFSMSIPKEDMIRFDRDTEPLISIINGSSDITVAKPALEKALAFYDTGSVSLCVCVF